MKKFLILILTLLVSTVFFAGCVTSYTPPTFDPNNPDVKPDDPDIPVEDKPYTARLVLNGELFVPESPISAQWYDGEKLYTAEFKDGIATTTEPESGDYIVTLTDLPAGYAYDPNINYVTKRQRNVDIELLEVLEVYGKGTGFHLNAYAMKSVGTYKVTFNGAGQYVYCNFAPSESGSYVFESIMDTTANEVNPRLEDFGQNSSWTPSSAYEICKDGGASSAYTRNFKYTVNIDSDCFNFIVKCDSRIGYPVDVYFSIKYESGYSRDPSYDMKVPLQLFDGEGNLKKSPAASGNYVKCGKEIGNNNHILDSSKFAVGDDGYYHLKGSDGSLTSSVLYADLSHFIGGRWEYPDAGEPYYVPTNLKVGTFDYLYFIKGWEGLADLYGGDDKVPEKFNSLKDSYYGYIDTAVSGNICAVTEELRDFMQAYSDARQLFFDGLGSAESEGYNASDGDGWLYFCGYFA